MNTSKENVKRVQVAWKNATQKTSYPQLRDDYPETCMIKLETLCQVSSTMAPCVDGFFRIGARVKGLRLACSVLLGRLFIESIFPDSDGRLGV